MKFLRPLFKPWLSLRRRNIDRSIDEKPKRLNKSIAQELASTERVSRFIYSNRAFSSASRCVKPNAFSPLPYSSLSVIHSTDIAEGSIWEIGLRTLGTQPGRSTIYGRADIPVGSLISQRLKALRDDDPFDRHTSVVGWPQNLDQDKQKADIKAICLNLSLDTAVKFISADPPIATIQSHNK